MSRESRAVKRAGPGERFRADQGGIGRVNARDPSCLGEIENSASVWTSGRGARDRRILESPLAERTPARPVQRIHRS